MVADIVNILVIYLLEEMKMVLCVALLVSGNVAEVFINHESGEVSVVVKFIFKHHALSHEVFNVEAYGISVLGLIQVIKQVYFLLRVDNRFNGIIHLIIQGYILGSVRAFNHRHIADTNQVWSYAIDKTNYPDDILVTRLHLKPGKSLSSNELEKLFKFDYVWSFISEKFFKCSFSLSLKECIELFFHSVFPSFIQ